MIITVRIIYFLLKSSKLLLFSNVIDQFLIFNPPQVDEGKIRSYSVRLMHVNGDAIVLSYSEFAEDPMVRETDSFKARRTGHIAYGA